MAYWLIKSEPFKYSYEQLQQDKKTVWDGVRNYAARLNLRAMKKGDLAFFYHSNEGVEIVGIAKITKEAFQDPTTTDDRWVAVEVAPYKKFKETVPLAVLKELPALKEMDLVRLGRLSVQTVKPEEWAIVLELAGEKV